MRTKFTTTRSFLTTTRTLAAITLCLLLPAPSFAHPAHETNAEMVWNANTMSLEVALKLRGIDLEAALTAKGSKRVDLEATNDVDARIERYLNRTFTVQKPDGSRAQLKYLGKAVTAREVWLYFEFPLGLDSPFHCSVSNRMLFEVLENQENKVAFRAGGIRQRLACNPRHPVQKLNSTAKSKAKQWTPPDKLESLPTIHALPDLFTMADGTRVSTIDQWNARREEIKQIIQYFEYGQLAPSADTVTALQVTRSAIDSHSDAVRELIQLSIGSKHELALKISIHSPRSNTPHPAIVLPVHRIEELACIPMLLNKGYALIQYERENLAPDEPDVVGPAQAAYPNSDWRTIAIWAWGAMRVVDYLETRKDMDLDRIVVTGHSRGGKAALLAGALDERFAVVAPNGSGCGGAGCFRNTPASAESLEKITDPKRFGYWFHPRLRWFAGQEHRLPFDQHFVKALVAPRALLCTEARGDLWANPTGTRRTSMAARDVYSFLAVGSKIGLSYRDGQHDQTLQDWQTLLDFADWHWNGAKPDDTRQFWQAP